MSSFTKRPIGVHSAVQNPAILRDEGQFLSASKAEKQDESVSAALSAFCRHRVFLHESFSPVICESVRMVQWRTWNAKESDTDFQTTQLTKCRTLFTDNSIGWKFTTQTYNAHFATRNAVLFSGEKYFIFFCLKYFTTPQTEIKNLIYYISHYALMYCN